METIDAPGYLEAVADERRNRAVAFLDQTEIICGVPVVQMTPLHWEWFRVTDNPFVCGGNTERPHILVHALWLISTAFKPIKEEEEVFRKKSLGIDARELSSALREYFFRTFLDSPDGPKAIPYISAAAGLIHAMSSEPYRWSRSETLTTPLIIIFQLIKARDMALGLKVSNKQSDKARGDWLPTLYVPTAKTLPSLMRKVNKLRKKGWKMISDPHNSRPDNWEVAMDNPKPEQS